MQSLNEAQASISYDENSPQNIESKSLSTSDIKENQYLTCSESSKEDSKNSTNSNGDSEEYLGYYSIYITNDQKDEREHSSNDTEKTTVTNENDSTDRSKPSLFPSLTLYSSSFKDENTFIISPLSLYQNEHINIIQKDRKMSSPICSYYSSSHKFLYETIDKQIIDYSKSNNFIKKDSLFFKPLNTQSSMIYEYTPKGNIIYPPNPEKGNKESIGFLRTNSIGGINEYSNLSYNKLNSGNLLFTSNRLQPPYSPYMKNNNNSNSGNKNYSKQYKPFTERPGDWVCLKCRNLNFAFRFKCNRCGLQKIESEKLNDNQKKNCCSKASNSNCLQNGMQKEKYYKYNSANNANNAI